MTKTNMIISIVFSLIGSIIVLLLSKNNVITINKPEYRSITTSEANCEYIGILSENEKTLGIKLKPIKNFTDELYISNYVVNLDKQLSKLGKITYFMPSGSTMYVYCVSKGTPHPYKLYCDNKINISELYDMAIGNFCTFKEIK